MRYAVLLSALLMLPRWVAAQETLGQSAQAILRTYCGDCHAGGKASKGGFGFVLDRDALVQRLFVVPGKAQQSDLFLRVEKGDMPPPSRKIRPTAAELKTLRAWIDAGAVPFAQPLANRLLTPAEASAAIARDLAQLDPRRRRFTRYLSLTHLAERSEKDIAITREATGKLLNSLSWHPRLALPEAVDAAGLLLRLDLRSYKWTSAQWDKLVAAYPYRAENDSGELVMLRADWFVANASRPPLYHELLQLPPSERGLERLLQLDFAADLRDDNVLRAGFNDSGVSKNNRLLERHDAPYGTLWRSFDFAANAGRQNLFEHPLGPNAGAISFQPAGGEMIFDLPNGLRGYFLTDAKGNRIDKAPGEIVADPRRPDQRVVNGLSCMSCHARGLLPKTDQIRPHVEKNAVAFGPDVVESIRATHPGKARFSAQVDQDNLRYLQALSTFGVRDPDQEPINLVTQRYEATVDGATAAAEMGVSAGDLARLIRQDAALTRTLGPLLTAGGTVQRSLLEDNFPELVRRRALLAGSASPAAVPFQGHSAAVNCVAFSSDGRLAASGSDDRTIRIWEVTNGRALATLQTTREVLALAFSPDGKWLVTGGADRVVRLWSLDAFREVRQLTGHTEAIRAVAFAADSQKAASTSDDGTMRVWDLRSGQEVAAFTGHRGPVRAVAWLDGARLLSAGTDGTIRAWELGKQQSAFILEGHVGPVLSLALAADGRSALSGGNDKTVQLWDLERRLALKAFDQHGGAVIHVRFEPDGKTFTSVGSRHKSTERVWRRWRLATREEIGSWGLDDTGGFSCAATSPDGSRLLVGGPAGFLRLVQGDSGKVRP